MRPEIVLKPHFWKILWCIFYRMWFFTCMCPQMNIQGAFLLKSFVAYFIHMKLFTSMNKEMASQVLFSLNPLFHTLQIWGFLPVCVRRWLFKLLLLENSLLQTSQILGFSSVCVRRWPFRSFFWENPLLHVSKTLRFSTISVERDYLWCFYFLKTFLLWMCPEMSIQTSPFWILFVTNFANMRLFTCMRQEMIL